METLVARVPMKLKNRAVRAVCHCAHEISIKRGIGKSLSVSPKEDYGVRIRHGNEIGGMRPC
ncbi:hypothetical protein PEP31012_03582 [Pandoraea eparura]|uniref:Uncharacterized protein n=1 Tax=Pandoraea eparura TaxID=2508291 RepID=A0A5E4WWQ5_9BURK|nr:hypothetical protein PEP31012_03582 [Pandoraea eparura]